MKSKMITFSRSVDYKVGSIIGANSIVTRDIPAYSVAVGIPAKVIEYLLK